MQRRLVWSALKLKLKTLFSKKAISDRILIYILIGIKTLREKKFQKPARNYEYGQGEQIEETGGKALLRGTIFLLVGLAMLAAIVLLHTAMLPPMLVAAILFFGAAAPVIW